MTAWVCDGKVRRLTVTTTMCDGGSGDLLHDTIIPCLLADGRRRQMHLPGILACLADPTQVVEGFPFLAAHHEHPWHAFLVQLAALVCQRHATVIDAAVCRDEAWWRDHLIALAGGTAAWSLLVDDLAQPAFLQPPVTEGRLDVFNRMYETPDQFDLPVTTKNHDCKGSRQRSNPVAWMSMLITGQTMQGFSGRANYGIFRMNGGLGNRPGIGYGRPDDLGAWFRQDLVALSAHRAEALQRGFGAQGHPLLWTVPWDGTTSLGLGELDPWCIECCRRVRLVQHSGRLVLLQAPTEAARVEAPQGLTGNVGDPWTPVAKADGKALTLPAEGFSYRKAQDLLFGSDWTTPMAQRDLAQAGTWIARTLVRGQGKTEGFHERHIPIAPRARTFLASSDGRARLAERAKAQVEDAATMHRQVLWPALKALVREKDKIPEASGETFEAEVDEIFFAHLWEHLEQPPEAARLAWQRRLHGSASRLLDQALTTAVPSAALRWRRIAEARSRFQHGLWKHFKDLMETAASAAEDLPSVPQEETTP